MKMLLALVFLFACTAAGAQPAHPKEPPAAQVGVNILWYGMVNGEGERDPTGRPEKTDQVPARKGAEFGVAFTLRGVPDGTKVKLRQVARYPAPGRHPPGGKLQKTDEADTECEAGQTCFTSYAVEGADEIIPGQWTLELYYRGRKLMEQRFIMRYEGMV
ncbi:MAG TPA: DUF3859 domain-containing protein [Burkholderiales bacterium]